MSGFVHRTSEDDSRSRNRELSYTGPTGSSTVTTVNRERATHVKTVTENVCRDLCPLTALVRYVHRTGNARRGVVFVLSPWWGEDEGTKVVDPPRLVTVPASVRGPLPSTGTVTHVTQESIK